MQAAYDTWHAEREVDGPTACRAAALGRFRPWMIHSTYDQSPTVVFHFPLLQDYITVDEYGWTMLEAG